MRVRRNRLAVVLAFFLFFGSEVSAQTDPASARRGTNEFYIGYSYLSNAFNSYGEFSGGGLNGWDTSGTFRLTRSFGVKAAALGEYGNSLGTPSVYIS